MKGTKKHAPVTLHDHSVDALMKQQTAECVSNTRNGGSTYIVYAQ